MSIMGDPKPCASQQTSISESPSSLGSDPSQHMVPPPPVIPDLPPFKPTPNPSFVWGSVSGVICVELLDCCYREAVHWVHNLFKVPSGRCGKDLVRELVRLLRAYVEDSALQSISLKAALVLPMLVLQKPHRTSKTKDHVAHLDRRLQLWQEGKFEELLHEGRAIQKRQFSSGARHNNVNWVKSFSRFMFEGKVRPGSTSPQSGRWVVWSSTVPL